VNRLGVVVVAVLAFLLASGCGGDSTPDTGSPSGSSSPDAADSSSPPAAAGSADDAFCTGWDKNGGTLASIGEPPTFYPKDDLVTYAEQTLAVMKGLTPPPPIAREWTAYQQFQTRLLAAARSLKDGRRLGGSPLGRDELQSQYKKINAWISAHC
jgi:hypothetical protein